MNKRLEDQIVKVRGHDLVHNSPDETWMCRNCKVKMTAPVLERVLRNEIEIEVCMESLVAHF